MHAPRSLDTTAPDWMPRWLASDSPYAPLLMAMRGQVDGHGLPDIIDAAATVAIARAVGLSPDEYPPLDECATAAMRALALPSDYATAGQDYVTHAPIGALSLTRDGDALAASNHAVGTAALTRYATALDELDSAPLVPVDYCGVIDSHTRHWAVGWIDAPSVAPFRQMAGDPARWILSPVWLMACALSDALADYPVLDEGDYSRREHEDAIEYLSTEMGETLAPYVLDRIDQTGYGYSPDDWTHRVITGALCDVIEDAARQAQRDRYTAAHAGQMTTEGTTVTHEPSSYPVAVYVDIIDAADRHLGVDEVPASRDIIEAYADEKGQD